MSGRLSHATPSPSPSSRCGSCEGPPTRSKKRCASGWMSKSEQSRPVTCWRLDRLRCLQSHGGVGFGRAHRPRFALRAARSRRSSSPSRGAHRLYHRSAVAIHAGNPHTVHRAERVAARGPFRCAAERLPHLGCVDAVEAHRRGAAAPQGFLPQGFLRQHLDRIPIFYGYHLARNGTSPVIVWPGSCAAAGSAQNRAARTTRSV